MSSQLRTAFGTACVVTSLLAAAAASAQSKRMWVDPPKDLGSRARPAPAAVPAPRAPDTSANKSAQPVAVATPNASESEAKVAAETTAKPKVAPTRRAAAVRAKARTRVAKPASARSGRVAAASRKARPQNDRRLASDGGPLVVMYLQTIELPDGRRYQVLTPRGQ